jgi:hypothetical protein
MRSKQGLNRPLQNEIAECPAALDAAKSCSRLRLHLTWPARIEAMDRRATRERLPSRLGCRAVVGVVETCARSIGVAVPRARYRRRRVGHVADYDCAQLDAAAEAMMVLPAPPSAMRRSLVCRPLVHFGRIGPE